MRTREIIAIDVGTASLSAALAKKGPSGRIEVVSVLRYPIDFFASRGGFDYRHRISYLIKNNMARLMADAHKELSGAEAIMVSISEPFFRQHRIRRTIQRKHPRDDISRKEFDEMITYCAADAARGNIETSSLPLRVVWSGARRVWMHDYELKDPVGYRGAELEIELELLLISAALCDYLEEFHSRWFPRAAMRYYTDPETLVRAMFASSFSLSFPALLLDIGGETTSITMMRDKETHIPCDLVFFGIRTLERRIAELTRRDMTHAESILRRYVSQTLDDNEASRIKPFLESAASEWRALVAQSLRKTQADTIRSIFFAGQGRDVSLFRRSIEQRTADFSGSPIELHELAISADQLFPPKILSSGGDTILASLLLYA